jgi:hypothetical protein
VPWPAHSTPLPDFLSPRHYPPSHPLSPPISGQSNACDHPHPCLVSPTTPTFFFFQFPSNLYHQSSLTRLFPRGPTPLGPVLPTSMANTRGLSSLHTPLSPLSTSYIICMRELVANCSGSTPLWDLHRISSISIFQTDFLYILSCTCQPPPKISFWRALRTIHTCSTVYEKPSRPSALLRRLALPKKERKTLNSFLVTPDRA